MANNTSDPKNIVKQGYDKIAKQYLNWSRGVRIAEREKYTSILLESLPEGARVLELGCGAGDPTTKKFAERFKVTGVDISDTQIEMAKKNVPSAEFIRADMTQLDFSENSFDGITAFYSITHVPRGEHALLLKKINKWLKPGGVFVASMSASSTEGMVEKDWLDSDMYFSGYDVETNKKLLQDAEFEIDTTKEETDLEFGSPTTFLWVVARKKS